MINFLKWLFSKGPNVYAGVVEKIDLTFGGAGNQVMTINGHEYATWIDHKKWPKIGSTVEFTVYSQGDGRGATLRCANILNLNDENTSSNSEL